ncbi:hypothetical protein DL766_008631 [Monosporascus sp. MC13-8B]|uniref:Ankyrin repeat protein n=1 Tax=Monosporascus cannonballus TaxID=155416 RepID=A0ABY0HFJ9_9PEZI|nr:hypothetical protein DL762_001754 [Monosporascus cannonballus]RYO99475.1 hypothetical protein DL763_001499 [Monosporascus cannonballus]RYP18634.1 hypothetical protein DL766_008631 [Monosporascus sp. MC13-8B]
MGADANVPNGHGHATLFVAIELLQPHSVEMLLEAGASLDHQGVGSYTRFRHYSVNAKGDPEGIAELGNIVARAGANIEKLNIYGPTLVFRAVEYDNAETFRTLYSLGVRLDVRVDGATVLHQAAYWGT